MVSTPESGIQITEVQRREQVLSELFHDSAKILRNPKNIRNQQPLLKRALKAFISSPDMREYELNLPDGSWEGLYDSSITTEHPNTLGFTRIQFNNVSVQSENEKPQSANLGINFRRDLKTLTLDRGGLPMTISDQEIESLLKRHIDEVRTKIQQP